MQEMTNLRVAHTHAVYDTVERVCWPACCFFPQIEKKICLMLGLLWSGTTENVVVQESQLGRVVFLEGA